MLLMTLVHRTTNVAAMFQSFANPELIRAIFGTELAFRPRSFNSGKLNPR
jgi:hypothetical protein